MTPPGCFARAETFVFCLPIKIIRRGRRPRRPGRGLGYRPWRGLDPSLRTKANNSQNPNGQPRTPAGRRGRRPLQITRKLIFGPEGVNRRGAKKREEKRSTPAFFSFFASRPQLWGSQGRVAHEAGSAASQQRDFFRFLFWSQKRKV